MAGKKEDGLLVVPCISSVQKMALYETKARFYLVGSNHNQKVFRVLKIDRTEPEDLIIIDDKIRYNHEEIRNLLTMIDSGNKSRDSQQSGRSGQGGLTKCVSAFGIFGFIRFCEGYYLILITKRRKIAVIGYNTVYKIEDTRMIRIPNDSVRSSHPDEPKYLRLFQSIDLSSNFYFSYSYDLSHTLQYNLAPAKRLLVPSFIVDAVNSSERLGPDGVAQRMEKNWGDSHIGSVDTVDAMYEVLKAATNPQRKHWSSRKAQSKSHKEETRRVAAAVSVPKKSFVWNGALVQPAVDAGIHPAWVLPVIHGFVGQSNVSVFGRSFYMTLIARRSTRYAGTRYLKRGANIHGDVANEVETEQILQDAVMNNVGGRGARMTSFVQLRGSIPGLWSQDIIKMVPKPPIIFHQADPYSETAGAHFNKLLKNYGSPILALNLVKKKEKKRQESQLSEVYSFSIQNLNVFLPPKHAIQYLALDMARVNKMKANVMSRLASIAHHCLKRTGIYCSHPAYKAHEANPDPVFHSMETKRRSFLQSSSGSDSKETIPERQTGIVRVNCVDCLDRTNTAQFAIGKCALAYQLYALGVIPRPELEFDSDCVRMLEMLYEDHGDFLALQYGGSQLVHRIQTYRRTAPWTAQGSDIMQTLSRYYSNAFSDNDKQNAINLLLGVFVPKKGKPAIWDLTSDIQLHNATESYSGRSCSQWWDTEVMDSVPFAAAEESKMTCVVEFPNSSNDDSIDGYEDFYHPKELAAMTDLLTFTMSHSCRDFMPNFTTDFSPFSVRVRAGKRVEAALGSKTPSNSTTKNPVMTGRSSLTSNASSNSSSSSGSGSDSEDDLDSTADEASFCKNEGTSELVTLTTFCPDHRSVYGTLTKELKANDVDLYQRFSAMAALNSFSETSPNPQPERFMDPEPGDLFPPKSKFTGDSWEIEPPRVSAKSMAVYENHVSVGINGPRAPDSRDMFIYSAYCGILSGSGGDEQGLWSLSAPSA